MSKYIKTYFLLDENNNSLIDEINNNSNKYMNINHKELVESILKTKNFDKVVVRDKVSKNNKNNQSKEDNARKEDESALCI